MTQELSLIIELQKIDGELLALQKKIEETPFRVKTVEKPLLDAKAEYDARKKKYDDFQKKRKNKDQQLDDISDKIAKLKDRTSDIKTNKEYQAHLKEIEKVEQERLLVEDEILVFMEQADDLEKDVKKAGDLVGEEEKKIEAFRRELETEVKELEERLDVLKAKRGGIASGIEQSVYTQYMNKLEAGQGLAVVEVQDSICLGCNMNIPPQLFVEVRKGEEIFNCPQCGRFLYSSHEQTDKA